MTVLSGFDATAPTFERYRSLPGGVAQAIRSAVLASVATPSPARVLDLGSGTGRIGKAFVEAGDAYTGVDFSLAMLREFADRDGARCLVQAEGGRLPFGGSIFDAVMLMHVLSGAPDRQRLLTEAVRVLRAGGGIIVGQTVADPQGIDAQMRDQLAAILSGMGIEQQSHRRGRMDSLDWLHSAAVRSSRVVAASWTQDRTAGDFLLRKRTGHRFAALPESVQDEAIALMTSWAVSTFGPLDLVVPESYVFELNVFTF